MADSKKSFLLYADYKHTIDHLSDEVAGKLFKHILSYVNDDDPVTDDVMVKLAFEPVKQQLKRDLSKWEKIRAKRAAAGKAGGLKKAANAKEDIANVANAKSAKENVANVAVNVNDNVNVNDTDNVNVINKEIDKSISKKKLGKHLFKNSEFYEFENFEDYFLQTDYREADLYYYHEAVKAWADSKGALKKDWIATARGFMLRDRRDGKLVLGISGRSNQTKSGSLDNLTATLIQDE